ncbi:unnamed protein product [Cuscuta epithymum]|uniref:Protein TIC 214 n=1 Tax=Cuscuta epithymum TaxID=186058 RepID=A0AAV0E5Y5_9ASTE|nr:unnamed protein product [Cuscuta epithymum]
MLFVISSFFAWGIGQILVINCLEFLVVWIQKNLVIWIHKNNVIRKYLVRNSIFFILLNCSFGSIVCILSIQSLGRTPLPIPTQKFSEVSKIEQREKERLQKEEEKDVEKKKKSTEEDPSLFSEEKGILEKELDLKVNEPDLEGSDSELEILEKYENKEHIVALLFDYKRWTRPFRYIKK